MAAKQQLKEIYLYVVKSKSYTIVRLEANILVLSMRILVLCQKMYTADTYLEPGMPDICCGFFLQK